MQESDVFENERKKFTEEKGKVTSENENEEHPLTFSQRGHSMGSKCPNLPADPRPAHPGFSSSSDSVRVQKCSQSGNFSYT